MFPSRLLPGNFLALLVLGLLVGLVYIQTIPLAVLPGRDNGFFLYAGWQILDGKFPYLDFWDSKGPLIFYLNALGLWLGRESRWGVWLLEVVFTLSAAFLGYRGFARKWGHAAALFASITWLYGLTLVFQGGNNTEGYTLLFDFLLIYFFLTAQSSLDRSLLLGLGFSLACSFLLRANNIGVQVTVLAALLLPLFWNRQFGRAWQVILWSGGAFLLTVFPVGAYFFAHGLLDEMFQASILYNFYYSGARNAFELNWLRGILFMGWPAYLAAAAYLYLFWHLWRKKWDDSPGLAIFLLLGWPLESLLSSVSGRSYNHYFVLWMPAMACLVAFGFSAFAAYGFSTPFRRVLEQPLRLHAAMSLVLLFIYIVGGTGAAYQDALIRLAYEREKGIEKVDPVARFVRKGTRDGDFVLVWGVYPGINFLARREAPTPYLFYPAYSESPYTQQMSRAFYEGLLSRPPAMIVDASIMSLDYILSINPGVRQTQLARNRPGLYMTPYQQDFFRFVEEYYERVEIVDNFEIYLPKNRLESPE